ncbi:MAG: hypoxanthine phosphoribosyltransferase [Clostridia bacterium]|jgi:hypoxanthine phosphoribosyltransferase|nr:hypoxanthine phosphoribosyltransferase [Clostridia bacterium]
MNEDIKKILISEDELKAIVERLGKQITEDYKGKNVLLIGILKGSVIFMADLMRAIEVPCNIDFMAVSSYGNGTESSGRVKINKDLDNDIQGKDIIIIEDILDSGKTLYYIRDILSARKPASIKICTLFDKPERREADIKADYIGSLVPNEFIVGYGLDYAEYYRNLPFIGVLKESVYENNN